MKKLLLPWVCAAVLCVGAMGAYISNGGSCPFGGCHVHSSQSVSSCDSGSCCSEATSEETTSPDEATKCPLAADGAVCPFSQSSELKDGSSKGCCEVPRRVTAEK